MTGDIQEHPTQPRESTRFAEGGDSPADLNKGTGSLRNSVCDLPRGTFGRSLPHLSSFATMEEDQVLNWWAGKVAKLWGSTDVPKEPP